MADVLVVAALQLSDPMLFAVLVKANDSFLHESETRGIALEVSGHDAHSVPDRRRRVPAPPARAAVALGLGARQKGRMFAQPIGFPWPIFLNWMLKRLCPP